MPQPATPLITFADLRRIARDLRARNALRRANGMAPIDRHAAFAQEVRALAESRYEAALAPYLAAAQAEIRDPDPRRHGWQAAILRAARARKLAQQRLAADTGLT